MIKAVIFDIGDVAVRPKHGNVYKGAMKGIDKVLGKFVDEENPVRRAVIRQRRSHAVNPEVMGIIAELKAAGYKTPSITNSPGYRTIGDESLDKQKTFQPLVSSEAEGIRKPDRRIYEIALRKIGFPAGECVFVDDKAENLMPALELGMKVILFHDARQLRRGLEKIGVVLDKKRRMLNHG
jgi:epoxide hydrolase-like predicted phosphatase